MEVENSEQTFIQLLVKNLQMLCHDYLPYKQQVEVMGHISLNLDKTSNLHIFLNEKCVKVDSSSVFTSNSFQTPVSEPKHPAEGVANVTAEHSYNNNNQLTSLSQKRQLFSEAEDASSPSKKICTVPTVVGKAALEDQPIPAMMSDIFIESLSPSEEHTLIKTEAPDILTYEEDDNINNEFEENSTEGEHLDESVNTTIKTDNDPEVYIDYEPDADDEEVEYTIVEMGTKQGKPLLVDSKGYSYNVRRNSSKSTQWACAVRNKHVHCSAGVVQYADWFKRVKNKHIHSPKPGLLTNTLIVAEARAQASNDNLTPTSEVVQRAMTVKGESDCGTSLPNTNNLKRMINRYRQLKREGRKPRKLKTELS